jgi:hypothetical protein|tara:strand:- start:1 stop:1878 length:1878 start_codon:yes stop_codon:yes gene_type:complete
MGFNLDTQATRSSLTSVDTTLAANINATQDYIPVASTANFSTSVVAEIETTNEVVSFGTISENLFPYSQELDNAYWGKARSTATADQGVAPDGTTTADLITQTASTAAGAIFKNGYSPLTNGAVYTYSAFAKYVTGSDIKFLLMQDFDITAGGALNKTFFNIETGAIGTSDSDHTATTTDVGNGWFRFTVTITTGNTGGNFAFYRMNADGGSTATINDTYLMWGLQLDKASAATTYLPTSSTALAGLTTVTRGVNGTTAASATSGDSIQQLPFAAQGLLSPVSTTLSANINATQNYVPLTSTNGFTDYLNATINSNEVVNFSNISENLFTRSEEFDNAGWTKINNTIVADSTTDPNGGNTADTMVENAGSGKKEFFQNLSLVNGRQYTMSVFAKTNGRFLQFQPAGSIAGSTNFANFNLTTGALGTVGGNTDSATITDFGNGWFRCSITMTSTVTASTGVSILLIENDTDARGYGYTGNGTSGIFVWGAQFEEASLPSTYLPTTSSALVGLTGVTRGVNGTTAQAATSGDTVTQTPLSTDTLDLPLRLKGLSVSSDGAGAGRFTLCDKVGDTICDVDIPNTKIFDLDFGGGIVFPNGIFISNSDNITAYTLYTDPYNTPNLTAGG